VSFWNRKARFVGAAKELTKSWEDWKEKSTLTIPSASALFATPEGTSEMLEAFKVKAEEEVRMLISKLADAQSPEDARFVLVQYMDFMNLYYLFGLIIGLQHALNTQRESLAELVQAVRTENRDKMEELSKSLASKPALSEEERKALEMFKTFVEESLKQDQRGTGVYG